MGRREEGKVALMWRGGQPPSSDWRLGADGVGTGGSTPLQMHVLHTSKSTITNQPRCGAPVTTIQPYPVYLYPVPESTSSYVRRGGLLERVSGHVEAVSEQTGCVLTASKKRHGMARNPPPQVAHVSARHVSKVRVCHSGRRCAGANKGTILCHSALQAWRPNATHPSFAHGGWAAGYWLVALFR